MTKHIINYLGSGIASKLIVFFSAIIYSRLISVEEFGLINLYISYLWIFVIVFSLNFYTAIGRYIYEDTDDFSYFFSTAIIAICLFSIFFSSILIYNIEYFELVLRLPRSIIYMLIIATIALISESILTQIGIYNQQSTLVFKVTFLKSAGAFVLSLIFLLFVIKSHKYFAVIYAEFLVNVFLVLYVAYRLKNNFSFKYKKAHMKYMANYSIPLIPYMLSMTLLSQSDRIMIDYFYGNKETGLYGMVYNLGSVLMIVVAALLNAWNPSYFKYMNARDYKMVEHGSDSIYFICFFMTLLIVLFGKDIVFIILSKEYSDSLGIIGVVAIGGFASTIWQIWGRVIGYAHKTYLTSMIAVVATVLNITLNYYLLPIYGYKIAAWTTFVSYLSVGVIALIVSNSMIGYYKVEVVSKILPIIALVIIYFVFEYLNIKIFYSLTIKIVFVICILFLYKNKILFIKRFMLE